MANQMIDIDTPTSSQPSTPQESHVVTPLTFQLHPSAIQAYTSSFNLNSASPNFISPTFPATVIQPSPFGSSINSMPALSQNINQPISASKNNSRKTTKSGKGKTQSSSSRQATTSKIQISKSTKTSKIRKIKDTDDDAQSKRPRKAPVKWEDDKNEQGESAMSLLLNWITTYGNWARYKDSNLVKSHTTEGIIDYLAENGIYGRNVKNVQGKISELEKQFNEAALWLQSTGQGIKNGIDAEKAKNNWTDDNPEYLDRKKRLIEDYVINKKCRYYYQVEHILGTRDKATRLDGANSAEPNSAEASLDCLGLSSKEINEIPNPNAQNDDNHSQASNEEYHRQARKSINLDNNFNISDDELRRVLDENFGLDEDSQPGQTQSSYKSGSVQPSQSRRTHKPDENFGFDEDSQSGQTQSSYKSGSVYPSQSRQTHKPGAETQITQLMSQKITDTQSSISRLEDIFIKSELDNTGMKDVMKEIAVALKPKNDPKDLLSKEELVEQAQVDAKLKVCQLEAAQLDVQKTRRAMELELAIAKGQFISQFMKDNNVPYEQAKAIAEDVYKGV